MTVADRITRGAAALTVAILLNAPGAASATTAGEKAVEMSRQDWKAEYVRPSEVPFPEENPYTRDKADLGHKLFFDPRLSGANYISCATCHNPSFSWGDGLPTGFGHKMTPLGRRTPTILNTAFGELMMWDGRFDSLEQQALGPMAAAAEMNQQMESIVEELKAVPGYVSLFNLAFPGEGITVPNIAKAIATFERTVVSGVAPFDLWIAGDETAIGDAAKRGFDLFNNKANCVACHSGWNLTDDSFHDIGLSDDDIGRGAVLKTIVKMQHAFKTPTLRNVVSRAPYMHDGSLATLADVIDHYDGGGKQRPSLSDDMHALKLTADEKADLIAFMRTLDGNDPVVAVPVLPANDQSPNAWLRRVSPAAGSGGGEVSPECRVARLHLRPCTPE